MNIVLMGYRGSGKSVIGRILSKRLKRQLFSIDRMIVDHEGMTVSEIVEVGGWPRFRQVESEMVEKAARQKDSIIDCGGGVVLDDQNVQRLKEDGKVVLLQAEFEVILERLRRGKDRPPLQEGVSFEEEQKRVIEERKEKYNAAADFICDTSRDKPGKTVQDIIVHFKKQGWLK